MISSVFPELKKQANSCPSQQCMIRQIQVQKPTLVIATNQMPFYT